MRDAVVVDPMGQGFEIPAASVHSITSTQGNVSYNNGTINWDLGTLIKPIEPGSDVKYAELHYRVSITDAILNADPAKPGSSLYSTNGDATVTYFDGNEQQTTKPFPVPSVDPIFISLEKQLYDKEGNLVEATGNTDKQFNIHVSDKRTKYDMTYTLKPGEKKVVTNLRYGNEYTVTEADTTGYVTTINDKVQGADTYTFVVKQDSDDIAIKVVNREIPKLSLTKTVAGELGDQNKTFNFDVTVKRGEDTIYSNNHLTLKHNGNAQIVTSDKALLPGDVVTITETDGSDYATTSKLNNNTEVTSSNNGKTVEFKLKGDTVVGFTNTLDKVPLTGIAGTTILPALPLLLGTFGGLAVLSVVATHHYRRHDWGE